MLLVEFALCLLKVRQPALLFNLVVRTAACVRAVPHAACGTVTSMQGPCSKLAALMHHRVKTTACNTRFRTNAMRFSIARMHYGPMARGVLPSAQRACDHKLMNSEGVGSNGGDDDFSGCIFVFAS